MQRVSSWRISFIAVTTVAVLVTGTAMLNGFAGTAHAAPVAKPSRQACTPDPPRYACLRVDARRVPSGETATFTGTLSRRAMRNLRTWSKGDNVVCLVRYKTTPEADGSWPGEVLEGACTTVRRDRAFTIAAELGRKGRYFYGVQMGPCRASAPGTGLCGSGDGGLLSPSAGARAVALRTT